MRGISVLAAAVSFVLWATPGLQAATPKAGAAPAPTISHRPLQCLLAGQFPRVDAGVTAAADLKSVRVYFRAHGHPDWYYVDMRALELSRYMGLLPQPLPETKQLDYYIGALDATLQSAQTREFEPEVSSGTCRLGKKPLAAWAGLAKIVLGGTQAGQLAIPPGFSSVGVSAFVDVTGAVTTGSALVQSGGEATATATSATSGATSGSAGGVSTVSSAGSASATAGEGATGAAAGGATAAGAAAAVATGAAVVAGGAAPTTALLIGGGAVVAAGAAVAVSKKGGGSAKQNHAPTAAIQLTPTTGLAGFTVISGVAAGVDSDGDALSYAWDLGDGERAAGATVTHVYQRTGTFTITLTISDPSGASAQAVGVVRVGSLTGLWSSPNIGDPPSYYSQWRCVQNANRLDCQSDVAMIPTASGSLRQPASIDFVYRYLDVYHAFPYNFVDIACSGDVRADFNRFACLGGPGNNDYGMERIGD